MEFDDDDDDDDDNVGFQWQKVKICFSNHALTWLTTILTQINSR